jgi:hypothetical protein
MKKFLLIGLAIMLLVSVGCGKTVIAGSYVDQYGYQYLDLKPDGTFYLTTSVLKMLGQGISGKWEVKGNEVRLSADIAGIMRVPLSLQIRGNKLYDPISGSVFEKRR